MARHARYVWINHKRMEEATPQKPADGLDFIVEVSPYDVPKAIVGKYDGVAGEFAIEFKYIDHEPVGAPKIFDGLRISSGRNSGRLQRIQIPVDRAEAWSNLGVIQLQTRVMAALRSRREAVKRAEDWNQDIAEAIIQGDEFKEVTEDLIPA